MQWLLCTAQRINILDNDLLYVLQCTRGTVTRLCVLPLRLCYPCLAVSCLCVLLVQHPGFDFSGATFNGMAPDAHTFMGGISADAKLD